MDPRASGGHGCGAGQGHFKVISGIRPDLRQPEEGQAVGRRAQARLHWPRGPALIFQHSAQPQGCEAGLGSSLSSAASPVNWG